MLEKNCKWKLELETFVTSPLTELSEVSLEFVEITNYLFQFLENLGVSPSISWFLQ